LRKLVECVPNFSEGRDRAVIDAIAEAIRSAAGCTLLDVDPGASTNRTVYTFVGPPEAVVEGALAGARVARRRIDMRAQQGEHPRVGALDVCPFVPVSGATMDDCVALANDFGRRAAEELGVPVYLYGHAARAEHRLTLQQIRRGSTLAERLRRRSEAGLWPAAFAPGMGATLRARGFLIYTATSWGPRSRATGLRSTSARRGAARGSRGS
jgi:glutamate formiminotransferase/formiminotetrahydrofolate cyclodeaminase